MTPREPDRFDKQAREILAADDWKFHERVAAALRAEHASALERAAQDFDKRASAIDNAQAYRFLVVAKDIRALIPPAAAPAAETPTRGQRAQVSLAEHRLRLKALFEENERRPLPDTALRAVLLDADRFVDEFCALATAPITPAAETGKAERCNVRDAEWLRAITQWQEHPRCSVTMEQMFYDARHPKDPYPSERCDGCDPVRLLLTRALRAAPPEREGK